MATSSLDPETVLEKVIREADRAREFVLHANPEYLRVMVDAALALHHVRSGAPLPPAAAPEADRWPSFASYRDGVPQAIYAGQVDPGYLGNPIPDLPEGS